MRHALALIALFVVSLPASALYKCTAGGKTVYSDAPCAAGQQATSLVPVTAPDPADVREAARKAALLKTEADRLRHDRERRQAQEESARARAEAGRLAHQKKCRQLEMKKRWSDEDASRAGPKNESRARRAAQRKTELYELECRS